MSSQQIQSPARSLSNKSSSNPIQLTEPQPISHEPHPPSASATATSSSNESQISPEKEQEIKDHLFKKVMKEEWDAVISIYTKHKSVVQTAKITRAKETALHVAISNGKKEEVKELLKIIDQDKIGKMTNDRDENPLHLAASLGQAEICKQIVEKDVELIGKRNEKGETPLFLAALQGKKGAFYALHPPCPHDNSLHLKHDVMHCKRNDGDSILHVAIGGDYLELAFQIINWYPELIKFYNEKGQSALHFLAHNPSAFRSGCHLSPLDDFLYRCVIIDPIKVEKPSDYVDQRRFDISIPVPKNYETCSDLLKIFINEIVHRASGWKKDNIKDAMKQLLPVQCTSKQQKQDMEATHPKKVGDQGKSCERMHIKVDDSTAAKEANDHLSTSRQPYPPNYNTFFRFLQFALELFLFILGLGFFEVRKIKEKKRKHTLTFEVMTNLVRNSKVWEYVDSGSRPTTIELYDKALQEVPDVTSNQDTQTKQSDQPSQDKEVSKAITETMKNMNELITLLKSQEKDIKENMIQKIISEMKGKKIQLEAEKSQSDVYNLQMLLMDSQEDGEKEGTPLLIAAKMGVKEMVEEILNVFPVAIWDEDDDKKNVVLLSVENRHPKIYNILLKKFPHTEMESLYKKVDKDGNSALHLAATIGKNQPWRIPGAALQMQWELKWYKFIKSSMPRHFFTHRNGERKTSRELFAETHVNMIKDGGTWLTNTSQSCSVVAALITTVGYASATTVPGGAKEGTGIPILRGHPAFDLFTISSLVALCLSVTSLTMFLSILTSRYQVSDFLTNLPIKLILGLTSLFISIAAMLVSFCAGHFFDLEDRLRQTAFPIYVITCLPITIFAVAQFPLYLDLIKSTIVSVPKRSYEITSI